MLLDYADHHEPTIDALQLIFERLKVERLLVPQTVAQKLFVISQSADSSGAELALSALQNLLRWHFKPFNLVAVGHGIVEQIGYKIRAEGLLPDEEENDSFIIAECALMDIGILISRDAHMTDAHDSGMLTRVLESCDVSGVIIQHPSQILRKFAPRRTT